MILTLTRWAILAILSLSLALAADVSGKWTASFETQIGVQNYTYELKVDAGKITGKAKSNIGEADIVEGTIKGDDIAFVENLKFQDQTLRIEYKGKVEGDEMKLTRQVGDVATEQLVAKRVK